MGVSPQFGVYGVSVLELWAWEVLGFGVRYTISGLRAVVFGGFWGVGFRV